MADDIDIVFLTEFTGVNSTRITDFTGLKEMGDAKIKSLVNALSTTSGTEKSSSPKLIIPLGLFSMVTGILLLAL
jgi:hypothetical protein